MPPHLAMPSTIAKGNHKKKLLLKLKEYIMERFEMGSH
jgi:hypothetical protein